MFAKLFSNRVSIIGMSYTICMVNYHLNPDKALVSYNRPKIFLLGEMNAEIWFKNVKSVK